MSSFDDVLERVLREEGWDVSRGPVDDSLLAEGAGERILVTWTGGSADDEAHGDGGTEFLRAQADARPADEAEPAEPAETPDDGPDLDDSDAEFIDATVDDLDEPDEAPEPAPEIPEQDPATDPDGAPEPETPVGKPDAPVTEPSTAAGSGRGTPLEEADGTDPAEIPVVRLRVDREEAQEEARPDLVDVQDTTLELVPHVAFEYTCRVPDGAGDTETYRGHILLNALTESAVTLEAPRFADGVPQGARLLDPELDEQGAASEARAHLDDRFTREVKVEEGDGNVSVMETKVVSPDEGDVDLEPEGTWYVPVWRLEGENGSVRLDANRGEVLDESLQQETGTDAEWVA
jgi:hypothetical protein